MDRSDYAADLLDMAGRFTSASVRRWTLAQWNKGYVPDAVCESSRNDIAAAAVIAFLEIVANHEPAEDGKPWIPPTPADRRRILWQCVRLEMLSHLRARANNGQSLEDVEPWQEPESDEAKAARIEREFQEVAEIVRQFKTDTDKRTGLAVAYSESLSQAAEKLDIHRANVTRRLKAIQRQFETPAQELCRLICEALETVRTDRPCLLAPLGIPLRSETLFGHRVTVRADR